MATTKREFLKRQEQMRSEMKELEQKAKLNAEKHLVRIVLILVLVLVLVLDDDDDDDDDITVSFY